MAQERFQRSQAAKLQELKKRAEEREKRKQEIRKNLERMENDR